MTVLLSKNLILSSSAVSISTHLFDREIEHANIDGFSLSKDSELNCNFPIFHDTTEIEIEAWRKEKNLAYALLDSMIAKSALRFDLCYQDSINTKYKCGYICNILAERIQDKYKLESIVRITTLMAEEVKIKSFPLYHYEK